MKKSNTAERLKEYMQLTGYRQVDLLKMATPWADKYNIKINKSHLSQYISGAVEPKQDKIFILARGLNVSEAWLMGYDVPMERDGVKDVLSLELTLHETEVITAYRDKPPMQPVVDKLLDVAPEDVPPVTHPFGEPTSAGKDTLLSELYGDPQDSFRGSLRAADSGFQNVDEFFSIKSKDKKEK